MKKEKSFVVSRLSSSSRHNCVGTRYVHAGTYLNMQENESVVYNPLQWAQKILFLLTN